MSTLIAIAEWIRSKVGWGMVLLTPVFAILAVIGLFLDNLAAGIRDVDEAFQAMAPAINDSIATLSPYFVYANTFFPVTEAFILVSALLTLRVLCAAVRSVKSLIPGLS